MKQFRNVKELKLILAEDLHFPVYNKADDWLNVLEKAINDVTEDESLCLEYFNANEPVITKLAIKTLSLANPVELREHRVRTIVREAFFTLCFDSTTYNAALKKMWRPVRTRKCA